MNDIDVEKIYKEIKDLKIQGNTNIAKTVATSLVKYVHSSHKENPYDLGIKLKQIGYELAGIRSNEPLSINAVSFITKDIEKINTYKELKSTVIERIEQYFKYIDESYEIIRLNGFELLKEHKVFYTHCHSALVRDTLIRISKYNPNITVINSETRPLYQGRITAQKLSAANINVIHIVDSAASTILLDKRYIKPEAVIVGCDGISFNGDLVNKIGTLNIAIAAKRANIPFYALTQLMKIDLKSRDEEIKVELRDNDEVWKDRPERVDILNMAFDVVPSEYITGGFITEKGIIKPEDIKNSF